MNPTDLKRKYNKALRNAAAALLLALFAAVYLADMFIYREPLLLAFGAVATALYGGLVLWFNLRWRSKFAFKNYTFSRVRLAVGLGAVLVLAVYLLMQRDVWLTQPYINRVPNLSDGGPDIAYDESTGVYTLTNRRGGDFRVLQLTDIHLGGSYASYTNDLKALKACFALIDHARPDLVVVTGDLSFPIGLSSFSLNNFTPTAASTSNSCRWRPLRRIEHEAREPRVCSRGSRLWQYARHGR